MEVRGFHAIIERFGEISLVSKGNMMATMMKDILTADQFVASIISVLALNGQKRFVLRDTELDEKFERAYEELVEACETLNVTPNFTFYIDPMHGDSVALRETLLAAKEKDLIALNNPTFHTFDVKLSNERATRYLQSSPIPREFLNTLVEHHFAQASAA